MPGRFFFLKKLRVKCYNLYMKIRRLQRDEMLLLVLLISLAGMGLVGYQDYQRGQKISSLEQELGRTRADAASTKETLKQTSDELSLTREARDTFEEKYLDEKGRMDTLALQLSTIQSSVGILEKLSKIDKELLKKYSKVYFLNENYIPEKLVPVDTTYAYNAKNTFQVQQNIAPHLQNLLKDATAAGIDIKVISAYRSFDTQGELKQSYKVVYGAGTANQFSADQGYSEHQLGTAVDFTTSSLGSNFSSFEKTPAYA